MARSQAGRAHSARRKGSTATAHTPGPWSIVTRGGAVRELVSGNHVIAHFWPANGDPARIAENDANAQLCAALPELLDALRLAEKWLANCVPTATLDEPYPLPVIAAAIAKAEGR